MLIFLNLDIDRLLDSRQTLSRLFPIRNPYNIKILDSYQHLGLFCGMEQDVLLSSSLPDVGFIDFLKLHGISTPSVVLHSKSPSDESFKDLIPDVLKNSNLKEGFFTGYSQIEEYLCTHLKLKSLNSPPKLNFFSELNNKRLLVDIVTAEKIPFPQTRIINSDDFKTGFAETGIRFPALIKIDHSAGGTGIISIAGPDDSIIKALSKILMSLNMPIAWLLQEELPRRTDLYLFGHVDSQKTFLDGCYELVYNKNKNSELHRSIHLEALDPQGIFRDAFLKIGDVLRKKNYYGFFGLDGFIDATGQIFPAIDLNVRLDKSRLIFEASKKFKIPHENMTCRRLNLQSKTNKTFQDWWLKCRQELKLNELGQTDEGLYFYPFVVGSLFSYTKMDSASPVEICYFAGSSELLSPEALKNWITQIDICIQRVSNL